MKKTEPARILVIDDNPADVLLLRLALDSQHEPYNLEVLSDGEEALRFVQDHTSKADTQEPCVLILDLHLPKYDGFDVLRAIRQTAALSNLTVIVFTGSRVTLRERAEIISLNVRLIVTKPSDLGEFIKLGEDIFSICREHVSSAAA